MKRFWYNPFFVALFIALLAPTSLLIYMVFVEPARLVVLHTEVSKYSQNQELQSIRIAVISDLHVGSPFNGIDRLNQIVEITNSENPDLILLLGDFLTLSVVGGTHIAPDSIAEALANLSAPLGVYSVLGNHDWWVDGLGMMRALESNGIVVLENSATPIHLQGQDIWLVGLADDTTRRPDLVSAFMSVPDDAASIIMAHDPGAYLDFPEWPWPEILLAGHTHGGQVYLPWLFDPITPGRAGPEWAEGLVYVAGVPLYVTSGVGTSILPIRLNRPPEIVILTLQLQSRDSGFGFTAPE